MPLSFKNIINENELSNAITTGDFSNVLKKPNATSVKYIKGYAQDSTIEALSNNLNINKGLFQQAFGIEKKEEDAYDPYHTTDAKSENFWYFNDNKDKRNGKDVQLEYDKVTSAFKRGLYSEFGYNQNNYWYEDPIIPSFELYFDTSDSPLFAGDNSIESETKPNSLKDFLKKYMEIDSDYYPNRFDMWKEFKNMFLKIFNTKLENSIENNKKQYYISKISGLNNLNKKMINYGEDKITITLNEDVSMVAWYISELYNNLIYSYKNQRYMFPDNVLRFNLHIKINDIRNFQLPQNNNSSSVTNNVNNNTITNGTIKNIISPKSEIIYELHDCNFNFFESRNHEDEIIVGGYGESMPNTPSKMSFDIIFKSVTRSSKFPLINNSLSISAAESKIITRTSKEKNIGTFSDLNDMKNKIKDKTPDKKSYLNNLLEKGKQTVINTGLNYMENLEEKLRNSKGSAINGLLSQFRNLSNINKIEPDNVYLSNFNDRTSVKNTARKIGSDLLNNLENTIRESTNF